MGGSMKEVLETINQESWDSEITPEMQQRAIKALENGKIVFFPRLPFHFNQSELQFYSPNITDPKSKNISLDNRGQRLGGSLCEGDAELLLRELLKRYSVHSSLLLENLFPSYTSHLIKGRTSYRPVQISGRLASYRKDDTRLHVDSFPATPVKGQRILRVFTNVNPNGLSRVWRVGEPFEDMVSKMAPRVNKPLPGIAFLLQLLKITKDYRTLYDHYMLKMHDLMKGDMNYQQNVKQHEIHFHPGSTWIVYTDQVSHAAMSGQYVFEQTYYLPVEALQNENTSPLRTLERYLSCKLT